ncbi:MAG: tetratricopeptide repeat protein [Nannocystaceae bacterium]|nr:tetratricopeptide repeat protein [Nannocystaceae bacterium]
MKLTVSRSILTALVAGALTLPTVGCTEKKESAEAAAARIASMITEADTRLRNNRVSDAEAIYMRILKEQPNNPDATGGLGRLRFEQDKFGEAETLLIKALETKAQDAALWGALGRALAHQDKHPEAAEAFGKAFGLDA